MTEALLPFSAKIASPRAEPLHWGVLLPGCLFGTGPRVVLDSHPCLVRSLSFAPKAITSGRLMWGILLGKPSLCGERRDYLSVTDLNLTKTK